MTCRVVLCALLLLPLSAITSVGQAAKPQTGSSKQQARQHIQASQQYLQQQRPDLAIPELQKAVALEPNNVDARGNLGVLLFFRGDYAGAVPELRVAVKLKPDLWKLQGLLGLAEERTGQIDAGNADLEAAFPHLTEQKFKTEVGNALVTSYTSTGETEKAAAIVSQLLADQPTNTDLLYSSYRLYSDLTDKAIVTMALTDPDGALMHEMMGRELARHGDEAQAIVNLREALKINPHLPSAHFELGELLYNSTNDALKAQAEPEFQAAIADNPADEQAHLMMGQAAAKRGDTKAAFTEDSKAVELQPNDADALVELGKDPDDHERKREGTRDVRASGKGGSDQHGSPLPAERALSPARQDCRVGSADGRVQEVQGYEEQARKNLPRHAHGIASEEC